MVMGFDCWWLVVSASIDLNGMMQYVKCGFAGENFPTSVFPCVVGRPMLRYEESLMEQEITVSLLLFDSSTLSIYLLILL